MNSLLTQIVLAQRGPGDEWMNLLFVIVMAVLWMVGGIIKAMKTKADNQQQTGRTPSRKPPDQRRGVRQQTPIQHTQRPAGPPKSAGQTSNAPKKRSTLAEMREAARRFAAEAEQAFKETPSKARPKSTPTEVRKKQSPAKKPQIRSESTPEIKPAGSPILQQAEKKDIFARGQATQQLSNILSDYDDPEKLRKAILHYEILGPPLSLRD